MYRKGFTLLELAIVLAISGLLIAGTIKLVSGAIEGTRVSSSKDAVQSLIKEVGEYSARAQSIPSVGTSDYSVTPAAGEIFSATQTHNDAFKQPLRYIPAAGLTAANVSGSVSGICGISSTNLSVVAGGTKYSNVAFVVVSGGPDKTVQTTVSADGKTVTVDSNNDIAGWMTFDTLRKFAGCDGYALGINQTKLPAAAVKNIYDYTLTPRGGKGPYQWCVETDRSSLLSGQMYYNATGTTNTSSPLISSTTGGCQPGNYVTGNSIHIHSNAKDMSFLKSDPANSKITVHLQDSNGISISKSYDLRLLKEQDLALKAPSKNNNGEGTFSGFHDFISSDDRDNTSGDKPNTHAYYFSSDGTEMTIVMNNTKHNAMESAFIGCNADPTASDTCPPFMNHGVFTSYFTLERYDSDTWSRQLGFTFALVKSYEPGTTYKTTVGIDGTTDSGTQSTGSAGYDAGLGYGGSGGDAIGIRYGNSFAIEFDTFYNGEKNDPYIWTEINQTNHMAIVNYTSHNLYNGTFVSYGNNIHQTITNTGNWVLMHNDTCSQTLGTGCYYNTSSSVMPNTATGGDKIGIRVEAVSGCDSTGTKCDIKTGANNYVCVRVWKETLTDITNDKSLANYMKDVSKSYTLLYINKKQEYPIGAPMLQQCYQDNTDTSDYLDYVRFGFTSSDMYSQYCMTQTGQITNCGGNPNYNYDIMTRYFKITDFKASVSQYQYP